MTRTLFANRADNLLVDSILHVVRDGKTVEIPPDCLVSDTDLTDAEVSDFLKRDAIREADKLDHRRLAKKLDRDRRAPVIARQLKEIAELNMRQQETREDARLGRADAHALAAMDAEHEANVRRLMQKHVDELNALPGV